MSEQTVVRRQVVVKGSPERAFAVFTDRFDAVKPREHNLLDSPSSRRSSSHPGLASTFRVQDR